MIDRLRNYALHGPYANQKRYEAVRNTVNAAFVDAYIAAEEAESGAVLRQEYDFESTIIDSLVEDLADAQEDVRDERAGWNTFASVGGCLIGGGIGAYLGGPAGAFQGCAIGSQLASTATDFAYDSEAITTDKETLMQEYADDLENYDVEFSPDATRFVGHKSWQLENSLQDYADGYYQDFETFEQQFYGLTGADYAGQFIAIGAEFAASKAGESLFDSWNKGSDTLPDIEIDWNQIDYGYEPLTAIS